MKNAVIIILLLISFSACHEDARQKQTQLPVIDTTTNTLPTQNIGIPDDQSDSCSYYVYAIVYTSDLKNKNKDYAAKLKDTATPISYFVDHSDDTSVVIHVGFDNEVAPGDQVESTIAWIYVDLKKNEVRDITIDPDNGILLKVDKKILKAMKKCNYKAP